MSQRFLNKVQRPLYHSLLLHAHILSTTPENARAFYQLLYLVVLEFSYPAITDLVEFLSQLQDAAQSTAPTAGARSLSGQQCLIIHAIVAGVMYLLAKMSSNQQLQEHVLEVVAKRRDSAPHLLPESLFKRPTRLLSTEEGVDGRGERREEEEEGTVDTDHLFQLRERGIVQAAAEPKKGYGKLNSLSMHNGSLHTSGVEY